MARDTRTSRTCSATAASSLRCVLGGRSSIAVTFYSRRALVVEAEKKHGVVVEGAVGCSRMHNPFISKVPTPLKSRASRKSGVPFFNSVLPIAFKDAGARPSRGRNEPA